MSNYWLQSQATILIAAVEKNILPVMLLEIGSYQAPGFLDKLYHFTISAVRLNRLKFCEKSSEKAVDEFID